MELAQVDFNYTKAVLQPTRMDELIWEMHEYWIEKKGEDKLNIRFADFPEDEDMLIIQGNKPLLMIALNNIVDNAYKYSKDAPVSIYFEAQDKYIIITVTDSGPGIKPEDIANIFKSFYRAESTRHIQGSGVGLFITHKIIDLCHGSIQVESDGSTGTSFIVKFKKMA